MERNDELIDKVIDYIREHPEEWNQDVWGFKAPCGTEACFAGHALLLSGYTFEHGFRDPEGCSIWGVPDTARELLGVTDDQSRLLFYAVNHYNGIEGLERVVAHIRAGQADTTRDCDAIRNRLALETRAKIDAEEAAA